METKFVFDLCEREIYKLYFSLSSNLSFMGGSSEKIIKSCMVRTVKCQVDDDFNFDDNGMIFCAILDETLFRMGSRRSANRRILEGNRSDLSVA